MVGFGGWIDTNKLMAMEVLMYLLIHLAGYSSVQALNCGWPGKPYGGNVIADSIARPPIIGSGNWPGLGGWVPPSRTLSYPNEFVPGQIVAYECQQNQLDVLRSLGGYYSLNRTCQQDGRWSGTRPFCDVNVVYSKNANYAGSSGVMSSPLMTDGLADSKDQANPADCPFLGKTSPYLSIDIGTNYNIRTVTIHGKDDNSFANLVGKKLTVGSSVTCQEGQGNRSSMVFQCASESNQYNPGSQQSNAVRFEHTSAFAVAICEVTTYVNPTLTDCGEPEIPFNGEVTITTQTSYQEAKYICNSGYELTGDETRTCNGRSWSGSQPLCIESLTSTTEYRNTTEDLFGAGDIHKGGGLETFQIVLIVVCVALAIGLIVALIVLLKYGKLTCCGAGTRKSLKQRLSRKSSSGSGKKSAPPPATHEYQEVKSNKSYVIPSNQQEADKRASAMAAADEERRAEEDFINARLAYQDERQVRSSRPSSRPTSVMQQNTYAQLEHEPRRRADSPPMSPSTSPPAQHSPVYSKVNMRTKSTLSSNDGESSLASEAVGGYSDEQAMIPLPSRKSYIPQIYLKESPEVQMKQQALNDQLKEAVKINRITDF